MGTIRKAISLVSGRKEVMPTGDILTNVGFVYNGTTERNHSEYVTYFNSGTTDANGRVTFNLTTDGTATGPAIFTAIHSANAISFTGTTTISNIPYYHIETISANLKQLVIRGVASQAGLVILGISISQVGFVGAGLQGQVQVWGLP